MLCSKHMELTAVLNRELKKIPKAPFEQDYKHNQGQEDLFLCVVGAAFVSGGSG